MLVAITSDIHNNLANLKKVLDYCNSRKIRKMICCGDLASLETLDFLNDNFSGEIFYCFGNMDDGQMNRTFSPTQGEIARTRDRGVGEKYKNTLIFKNYGEIKIANKAIAFVHYPDKAKRLAESGKYEFVFYGHTHKPWEETVGKCKMLNPGNVAGEIYLPTFAVWNTENNKFKLVRIHNLT